MTTPVQGNFGTIAGSTSQVLTPMPGNVAVGDEIVMGWRIGNTTTTITGITDNLGNSWATDVARFAASTGFSLAFFRTVVTVAGAMTITVGQSAATSSRFAIEEYSGLTSTQDGTPNHGIGTGLTLDSGALTTATAGDTLFGFGGGNIASSLTEGGTGTWVARQSSSGLLILADQIGVATGTYHWQPTVSSSQAWAAGIIAYKVPVSTAQYYPFMSLLGVG